MRKKKSIKVELTITEDIKSNKEEKINNNKDEDKNTSKGKEE